jgi:hypothetical protein
LEELIRIFNEGQTSFLTLAVTPSTQAKEICAHATRKCKLEGDERFSLAVEKEEKTGHLSRPWRCFLPLCPCSSQVLSFSDPQAVTRTVLEDAFVWPFLTERDSFRFELTRTQVSASVDVSKGFVKVFSKTEATSPS